MFIYIWYLCLTRPAAKIGLRGEHERTPAEKQTVGGGVPPCVLNETRVT